MVCRGLLCAQVFGACVVLAYSAAFRPNIVVIVADDLGWNDVGFHGSDQVSTPNIDALAYNGVILNNHYVQPMCTPSRAALMTGVYPVHSGMQGLPTLAGEPNGLPLTYRLLPQYLRELGYVTRAVGKWHLGFYRKDYLPQYRGFESHLGIWAGFTSYYDYILQDNYNGVEYNGFDLHRDTAAAWDLSGKYATDVFTDEAVDVIHRHNKESPLFLYLAHLAVHAGNRGKFLEAPQEDVDRFPHITDPNRRTYAAMVAKLDESVGRVVAALQNRFMLDNTIIVFMSDNGAPSKSFSTSNVPFYPNWGSNFPLKGAKETLWEGGVRSPTLIWSKQLQSNPRVYNGLLHITDWLPTLYKAAGGFVTRLPAYLDGKDQWSSISLGLPSVRNETLLNINEKDKNAALISVYNPSSFYKQTWKVVYGSFKGGEFDGYYQDTRSPANPVYNMTGVQASAAHRALRTIHPTASPYTMLSLRSAATVSCPPPTQNTSLNCHLRPCLFDLERDPCESTDVAHLNPYVTETLYDRLVAFRATLTPQTNRPPDAARADPRRHNNTWAIWAL